MADFQIEYADILNRCIISSSYSNQPSEEWKGIVRPYAPNWDGWRIIDRKRKEPGFPTNLASDEELECQTQKFYKTTCWDVFQLDVYPSQGIAGELFTTSVSMEPRAAINFLQRSLNVLNRNEELWPDVQISSEYDQFTHNAIMMFFTRVPRSKWNYLLICLNALQGTKYIEVAEKDPTQQRYMYRWLDNVGEKRNP